MIKLKIGKSQELLCSEFKRRLEYILSPNSFAFQKSIREMLKKIMVEFMDTSEMKYKIHILPKEIGLALSKNHVKIFNLENSYIGLCKAKPTFKCFEDSNSNIILPKKEMLFYAFFGSGATIFVLCDECTMVMDFDNPWNLNKYFKVKEFRHKEQI